ncbi:thrombospondin type-1 domain-containing protein 7B-like [Centruroides vittatus]|uniref:thrombospondin type-1 domain-containing protein 7B-like n=1 Tax=Centruroides vittatus TaxID=120091 RepID=UPI00350ECCED
MNTRVISLRRIFILLLCQWANIVDGTLLQFVNYVWKTGSWNECSSLSRCGEGVQTRKVWCSDISDDRTTLRSNCGLELKPPENQTCFVPCKRHKNSIRWKVGNWGACVSKKHASSECDRSGWQERSVHCVRNHNRSLHRTIKDSNCLALHPRPPKERSCLLKCPQDCIVSLFGNWSGCGVCGPVNRTRTRSVLVAPKDGGRECPHLTESRECSVYTECLRDVRLPTDFVLKIGPWSPCTVENDDTSSSRQPVVGYRKRNVTCIDKMGETTDVRRCKNESVISVESCVVTEDCHVTEWSEWILVKTGCVTSAGKIHPEIKERRRKVIRLAEGDGASCPHLTEKRRLVDKLPPCSRLYNWSTSTWNDCQPYKNWCGGGLQIRNVFCVRLEDYVPVGDSFCKEPKPSSTQQCNFECPRDCKVSLWSSWGVCLPFDDKDTGKSFGGYRKRRREIVLKPSEDRLECPALVQVDSCIEPMVVKWLTGNWSKCLLRDATQPCGEGVRNREAVCVTPTGVEVSPSLCQRYVLPPKLIAPCYIPCPRDCVLAEWTEWTHCSTDCTNSTFVGKRTRHRNVLAKEGPGGKPCPDSDTLTESEFCSYESCSGYNWEKSDWSSCKVPKDRTCGKGIRNRYVNCVHENTLVPEEKCMPEPKPFVQQSCFVPCPVDCVTSNFTEWTPCPNDCKPGSVQHRKRYILQHPRFGGMACPQPLEEITSCHFENDECRRLNDTISAYRWDIGAWSGCVLTEEATCGRGYQTRRVICTRYDGKKVIVHNCLTLSTRKPPIAERSCYVSCNKSCDLSEWSSWTLWRENKTNVCLQQIRIREIIGGKCDNELLNETLPPILPEILAPPEGHWSKCIIDEKNDFTCGNGKKYIRGNQVNLCQQTGVTWDMCLVECPESCQLSEWTQWTQCNVSCGQGYRRRQRHVVKYGNKMGRPCPVLNGDSEIQESICEEACEDYKWIFRGWSECRVISSREDCGKGVQTTVFSCTKINKSTSRTVDDKFCLLSKPVESVSCHVPCPDDCVVSSWSSWTQCSEPCNNFQQRYRNRTVLRMALPSSGRKCPTLTEEEACHKTNCFFYKWKIGKWSSCILPEESSCGWGTSHRAINCQRNDGSIVSPDHCRQLKAHSISTPCFVDCPIDCEMSKWSFWNDNECKPCASKGERWRTRTVIQEHSKTGKPCPSDVIQRMPCPHQPCYYWSLGDWSNCLLNEGECGYGITNRKVNCIRSDGVTVHKSYCLTINISESIGGWMDERWLEEVFDVKENKLCHVPCPGGCILSSWSSWSPCHRNCLKQEIVGYRTRSRAILVNAAGKHETCPKILWEKRPCWDGPCLTYGWKLKNNVIQCVRSDGLVIEGGCEKRLRPCYPECSAPDSFCDHALGQCVCPADASPVYNGRTEVGTDVVPHLLRCLPNAMDRLNVTRSEDDIILRYFPDDNEFSFWMYAMICAGSAFVIFVVVTLYLMCIEKPSARQQEPTRGLHMKTYYR